jgi:hypothetical protein
VGLARERSRDSRTPNRVQEYLPLPQGGAAERVAFRLRIYVPRKPRHAPAGRARGTPPGGSWPAGLGRRCATTARG